VSGCERRECREREEERKGKAAELDAGEELRLFLPTPSFMAPADEEKGTGTLSFHSFFPFTISSVLPLAISLVSVYSFLGQAWAEGKGELATCRLCAEWGRETWKV